jgi:hypothetical protein
MVGLIAPNLSADPITQPEEGKTYCIQQQATNNYFTLTSSGRVKVYPLGEAPNDGDSQIFTFESVAQDDGSVYYKIKDEAGRYVGTDSGWTTKVVEADDAMSNFTFPVSTYDSEWVNILNMGHSGNSYWASDDNNNGTEIWTNKGNSSGYNGRNNWKIIEYTGELMYDSLNDAITSAEAALASATTGDEAGYYLQSDIDVLTAAVATAKAALSATTQNDINTAASTLKDALSTFTATRIPLDDLAEAIEDAQKTLDGATIGSETGNYTQEGYNTFTAAIETAKGYLTSTSKGDVEQAISDLNSAVTAFSNTRIMFAPKDGAFYYFTQTSSGKLLGMNDTPAAAIQPGTLSNRQKFMIESSDGSTSTFRIKYIDDNGETQYLATKGSWDTTATTDGTADVCQFDFVIRDLAESTYVIKRKGSTWQSLASDSTSDGALVYSDKYIGHTNGIWKIVEWVEGSLFMEGFNTEVEKAYYMMSIYTVGTDVGCYPQSAFDALTAAVEKAKTDAAAATTQDELNAVTDALNAARTDFKNAVIVPVFDPAEGSLYRFSTRKYIDKYMVNNDGDAKTTAEYVEKDATQHWSFEPVAVEGLEHTFVVKNDGKSLNYDGTVTEKSNDEADKWQVNYVTTVSNCYYYALVEAADPTQVLAFGSGKTWAIQNFDSSNSAHQHRLMRVDLPNDPKTAEIDEWIVYAKGVLRDADKGNAVGQYNQAKCDAFQAVINKAINLTGEEATTGSLADMVTELSAACTNFINNPNSVVKDELEAAIAAAKEAAANAVVGIEVGQYYLSEIENFEDAIAEAEKQADEVSEQDACDELTEAVKSTTESFKGNETVQTVKAVLTDYATCCEALYNQEKDNVGTDEGQRSQDVIDAFKAAIDAAKAATDPTIEDLEALIEARSAFLNGAVNVNRTAIRKAIAAAQAEEYQNLVAGNFNGNYGADEIAAFQAALADAVATEADMDKTQEEIDAATKALNDAMTALKKSKVTVTVTALNTAIANAKAAIAGVTEIGDGEGQCPQSVVDTLNAVIAKAEAVDANAISQADVDALVEELNNAVDTFNTQVKANINLSDAINDANDLLNNSTEGFKPGNYPSSAFAALESAVAAAEAVNNNADATQAELIAALKSLREAIETFKSAAVAENDLTNINALIAEAEQFIADSGANDSNLNYALELAKAVVADPNNYTKTEVTNAYNNLKKALDFAKANSGLNSIDADTFGVKVVNGSIIVTGLNGSSKVVVYSLDGRVISATETVDSYLDINVATGVYVVVVNTTNNAYKAKVTVK